MSEAGELQAIARLLLRMTAVLEQILEAQQVILQALEGPTTYPQTTGGTITVQ